MMITLKPMPDVTFYDASALKKINLNKLKKEYFITSASAIYELAQNPCRKTKKLLEYLKTLEDSRIILYSPPSEPLATIRDAWFADNLSEFGGRVVFTTGDLTNKHYANLYFGNGNIKLI